MYASERVTPFCLRSLLGDQKVRAYLETLKAKRLGLVLSGGGGKGAYEAGALLALFDCGIRSYAAISGTSVGGLNAALCHELCRTGDRDAVLRVWSGMSWRRVFALHPLRVIAAALARLFLLPSDVLMFLHRRLIRVVRRTEVVVHFRPFTWRESMALRAAQFWDQWMLTVFMVVGFLTLRLIFAERRASLIMIAALSVLAIGLLARPAVARFLAFATIAPLRAAILRAVDPAALWKSDVPVFVTMTGDWLVWNDAPKAFERQEVAAPTYVDLRDTDGPEMVLRCLLQSAAIPVLFPAASVHGMPFVDGGLTDNRPILPVLLTKPEMMIVVFLEDEAVPDLWLSESARTFWLFDLMYRIALHEEGDFMERIEWRAAKQQLLVASERIRLFGREQFLPIVPRKHLGGFWRGTLNFHSRKADTLMAAGYRDTLETLRETAAQSGSSQ